MKTSIFKKFFCWFLIFVLSANFLSVFSATSSSWNALENFTNRQYELLFDSNLSNISDEYWDIFDITKKLETFTSMSERVKKSREIVEVDNENILNKITNLEETKKQIENEIKEITEKIKDISLVSIQLKTEIELTEKKIESLKIQIEENRNVLLEYIDYMYKKWNTAYEWDKIDNLKSIILNNEEISNVINDLYFNSIVQKAGKTLIDKHMKFVWQLYEQKVNLEEKKVEYAKIRKQLIIEQKNLKDKKDFQERLLEISKNKQKEYEKIIAEKLETEKKLKEVAKQQELKIKEIRDKILSENGCEFKDFWQISESEKTIFEKKNKKCYNLNNIIYLESQLRRDTSKEKNPMIWPVDTSKWISAFYRDPSYRKVLWADHSAIDIRANQWSDLKAAMAWYIIYINPPTTPDYSFLAIKHPNWYTTVYWHLSEINVKLYQYVDKWEIIWKTWGSRWTLWAWYLSTWPHLHFEVFKDKEYIDPLDVLDLSYLKYNSLPSNPPKYKLKYLTDFKERRWYDLSETEAKTKLFKIVWENEIERQKNFIAKYAWWTFRDHQMWVDQALIWNIDPSVVMCIWLAESGLWRNLTTWYNVWNVWNNDRWDRVSYSSAKDGIYAIVRTLNNKYFKNVNRLDMLSWAWRIASNLPECSPSSPCYATDPRYWHPNVITCLSHLKWRIVEDNYNFRIIK